MKISKREFLAGGAGMGVGLALAAATAQTRTDSRPPQRINSGVQPSSVDLNYKARRFNKAIELWEDGQPVFYATERPTPGVNAYERGKLMCKTYADAINYDMEHVPFNVTELGEFMRGLADGGGTRSGHRFPAVFVTCPVLGLSEEYAIANSWVMGQILDTGVSGIQLCHARDPKAVEVMAHMACRYPFEYPGVPRMRLQGIRGASAEFAARVWGMNNAHYVRIADLWPLNPRGEIIFVGRKDSQIKHQGYRIELGEIELAAGGLPGVRSACVIYNSTRKEITLFFDSAEPIAPGTLRMKLSELLPKYMLPTAFHRLCPLPLNANGKIDRRALAASIGG